MPCGRSWTTVRARTAGRAVRLVIFLVCASECPIAAATIEGLVAERLTRQPVAGATVRVIQSSHTAVTDEAGRFLIANVAPGHYDIRLSHIGYADASRRVVVARDETARLTVFLRTITTDVGGLTVTATRFGEAVFSSAQNVSVTPARRFAERDFSTTAEVLREEPGVLVQKTTHGHGSPVLRGLLGKYVLLLYDGIRLNKPTFRFGANQYLNTVDLATVDRVEVVRGPSSVMYGSDAIGGVINLVPLPPRAGGTGIILNPSMVTRYSSADDGKSVNLRLTGSYRYLSALYAVTLKDIGDLRAGGEVGKQRPTGWQEANHSTHLFIRLDENSLLRLDYLAVRQTEVPRYDRYVSGDFQEYVYDPQDRDLLALTVTSDDLGSSVHSVKAAVAFQREVEGYIEQRTGSAEVTQSEDEVRTWGGYVQLASVLRSVHWLSYGLEHYRDRLDTRRMRMSGGATWDVRPTFPDESEYRSTGLFLQDEWRLQKNVALTTGVRYSRFAIDSPLEDPFGRFEDSFDDVTAALSLSVKPDPAVHILGRWSRGFRAPDLNDEVVLKVSSSGVDAPSPGLGPEHCNNFELGTKVRTARMQGSLFLFYNQLSNLIDRRPGTYDGKTYFDENGNGVKDSAEFDIFQKYNVGRSHIYGFEYESFFKISEKWEARAACFWTRGENHTANEPLSRIPPFMGMVSIRVHPHARGWVELFVRMAGEQRRLSTRDIDDTRIGPEGTDGWATLNFRSHVELGPTFVNITLENVTDRAYKEHGSGICSAGRGVVLAAGLDL